MDLGITLFAGEADGRIEELLLEIFPVTQAARSAVNKQLHRRATAATGA